MEKISRSFNFNKKQAKKNIPKAALVLLTLGLSGSALTTLNDNTQHGTKLENVQEKGCQNLREETRKEVKRIMSLKDINDETILPFYLPEHLLNWCDASLVGPDLRNDNAILTDTLSLMNLNTENAQIVNNIERNHSKFVSLENLPDKK